MRRIDWTHVSWGTGAVAALVGAWIVVHALELLYRSQALRAQVSPFAEEALVHWAALPWAFLPLFSLLGILIDRTTLRLTPVLLLLAGSSAFVTQVGSGFMRDTLLFLLALTCHEVARLRSGATVAAPEPTET